MSRHWTPEQRQAAAERMRKVATERWKKVRQTEREVSQLSVVEVQNEINAQRNLVVDALNTAIAPKVCPPEVHVNRGLVIKLLAQTKVNRTSANE